MQRERSLTFSAALNASDSSFPSRTDDAAHAENGWGQFIPDHSFRFTKKTELCVAATITLLLPVRVCVLVGVCLTMRPWSPDAAIPRRLVMFIRCYRIHFRAQQKVCGARHALHTATLKEKDNIPYLVSHLPALSPAPPFPDSLCQTKNGAPTTGISVACVCTARKGALLRTRRLEVRTRQRRIEEAREQGFAVWLDGSLAKAGGRHTAAPSRPREGGCLFFCACETGPGSFCTETAGALTRTCL
jgi:hypothetical protein